MRSGTKCSEHATRGLTAGPGPGLVTTRHRPGRPGLGVQPAALTLARMPLKAEVTVTGKVIGWRGPRTT